jgi:hypothetical protein
MKKLLIILMLIPVLIFGQGTKNNIYAEAHAGILMQGVINYERQINLGEKVRWYGRLGGGWGFNGIDGFFVADYGVGGLGAITMLIGKKNNNFELNAGAFIGDDYGDTFLFPILNIGYRYQETQMVKARGGLILRVNLGYFSAGLSFGYAF